MMNTTPPLRQHARDIWQAAVDAVAPETLIADALAGADSPFKKHLTKAPRIIVVGAGKAGAAMSAAVETQLADYNGIIEGLVNVPAESVRPLRHITLHAARPAGTNHPTPEGVIGTRKIIDLVRSAGPDDVVLCLLSGGGSALLPAPIDGISLEDKQMVTHELHACGATINEMNAVRKHLSAVKGGRLAQAFSGSEMVSLIISDVIGDPLDVIASGPTAPDPTTFADALAVLQKYDLLAKVPQSVRRVLETGNDEHETPKTLPKNVANLVIGNNAKALIAAQAKAEQLGYPVLNLGSYIEGETRDVAIAMAGVVRSIKYDGWPMPTPVCILSGGETTVTLSPDHGKGGRNQEFVLAMLYKLGEDGMRDIVVLSGGTDGEDGPTDAAGAVADSETLAKAKTAKLNIADYLRRNDAYHFFEATDDLIRTGLTHTNVMDMRVIVGRVGAT